MGCFQVFIIAALCTNALAVSIRNDATYPNQAVLDADGHFQLFWSFDNDTITMQYQAMSKGWIGLGFSPNGAMTGADIALFWIDQNGKGQVSDRHASENGFPPEDAHQDYELLDASKNETHIIVKFTRKRNTCDKEDWPLAIDTTRVIYAANDKVPADKDHFAKHTVRGSKSVHFFDQRPDSPDGVPPEEGATPLEFRVNKVAVPDTETTYWCEFMALPKLTAKKHMIKAELVIQSDNLDIAHHMLLYICGSLDASQFVGQGAPCFDGVSPIIQAFGQCQSVVLAAWAVGGQSVLYPEDIGLPLFNPHDNMYVMLEMHYNNAQYKKGKVDSSGFRLWITDKLRPIEASKATLGLVTYITQLLPPGMPEITSYGYCTSESTKDLPADGIQVIGGLLHTHLAGRKVRLLHYRNGVQLPNILADEFFDFNYQDYRRLTNPVTVLPGDDLIVECVYDTSDRTVTTFGGISTQDEMCLVYLDYYPSEYTGFLCESQGNQTQLFGALDRAVIENGTIEGCSDTLYNCIRDYKWSDQEKTRIVALQRDGQHANVVIKEFWNETAGNISQSTYDMRWEVGYPTVTKPYIVPDVCQGDSTVSPSTIPATSPSTIPATSHRTGDAVKTAMNVFVMILLTAGLLMV